MKATSRTRIAFFLVAALVVALALSRWTRTDETTAPLDPAAAPSPRLTGGGRGSTRPAIPPSATPVPTQGPSAARPAPSVFDFAKMTPPGGTAASSEERFQTTDWFTEEDLRHPERYFEVAERVPELNRPEERRDTLAFFLAYREKLGRDLEATRQPEQRAEVLATIERYDNAIARLRALIAAAGS